VRVQDGVATLSGFVWDPQDIYRASELAAHLPGVNGVIDELELKRKEHR
jgi:osmotically-inducible protein OsmY